MHYIRTNLSVSMETGATKNIANQLFYGLIILLLAGYIGGTAQAATHFPGEPDSVSIQFQTEETDSSDEEEEDDEPDCD